MTPAPATTLPPVLAPSPQTLDLGLDLFASSRDHDASSVTHTGVTSPALPVAAPQQQDDFFNPFASHTPVEAPSALSASASSANTVPAYAVGISAPLRPSGQAARVDVREFDDLLS